MSLTRSQWIALLAAGVVVCAAMPVMAQTQDPAESPFQSQSIDGSRFRDNRDRGLSESARRFGREHHGAIILGIEPIMSHGRSLNRIKSMGPDGRVVIWIDDPQQPKRSIRRADDDDGW